MSASSHLIKRFYLAFAVLITILVLLMAGAFRSLTQLAEANRWNIHTYEVLVETHGISQSLTDMEAGSRGFAVTGEKNFLPRLTRGRAAFSRHLNQVQTLNSGDPAVQDHLHNLQEQYQQWMSGYVEPMLAVRRAPLDDATMLGTIARISLHGKSGRDAMHQTLNHIDDRESVLLEQRDQRASILRSRTMMLLLMGGLFAIVLTAALCMLLTGNMHRLTTTNAELAEEVIERKQAEEELAQARDEAENAREVAEQARKEAESASAAKSEFLSRMSHELRTPLNAILGFGQLLEMDDLDEEQRRGVEQILKGGRHLLELVNEVLDIASIDAGRMTLSSEPVHLDALIQETMELLQPLAAARGIRFENDIGANYVLADQQRLKQVVLNLLSNSVKYNCDAGWVRISSGTATQPGRVRFEVSDSGSGILPAGLEKMFAPFERLDAEQKGVEGTGIGLTISQRLVHLMDGEIGVYSMEGEGTTFWVELPGAQSPLQEMEHQTTVGSEAEVEELAQNSAANTVLYIEDNLSNLKLIDHIFTRHRDIRLLSAMQGRIGLELAREHHPDLILLDLHLPDIPGDEVLQHLRAEIKTHDIPVVILSADATPRQVERLLEAGAAAYLTKPLDVKQFLQVMDQILNQTLKRSQ